MSTGRTGVKITARSRRRIVLRLAVVSMAVVVVAVVGYGLLLFRPGILLHTADPTTSGGSSDGGVVGVLAPTVSGENYAQQAVSVDPTQHGAVVVVVAHWCDHCQSDFRRIAKATAAGNFELDEPLIAISTRHLPFLSWPPTSALDLNHFPGEVIVDTDGSLGSYFHVNVTPTWFFTDRNGVIREIYDGELSPEAIQDHARKADSDTEGGG